MMTTKLRFILACTVLLGPVPAAVGQSVSQELAQKSASAGFRPAVFHGLQMGKAKRADVLRVFGKPTWEGLGDGGGHWMSYRGIDGIEGLTQFVLDEKTMVVEAVDIGPQKMSTEQLEQRLGRDYVITRWTFSGCDGDIGMARVYLDPDGSLIWKEYRRLGIAVQTRGLHVEDLVYRSIPIGLDHDPCQPKPRRSKAKRQR